MQAGRRLGTLDSAPQLWRGTLVVVRRHVGHQRVGPLEPVALHQGRVVHDPGRRPIRHDPAVVDDGGAGADLEHQLEVAGRDQGCCGRGQQELDQAPAGANVEARRRPSAGQSASKACPPAWPGAFRISGSSLDVEPYQLHRDHAADARVGAGPSIVRHITQRVPSSRTVTTTTWSGGSKTFPYERALDGKQTVHQPIRRTTSSSARTPTHEPLPGSETENSPGGSGWPPRAWTSLRCPIFRIQSSSSRSAKITRQSPTLKDHRRWVVWANGFADASGCSTSLCSMAVRIRFRTDASSRGMSRVATNGW